MYWFLIELKIFADIFMKCHCQNNFSLPKEVTCINEYWLHKSLREKSGLSIPIKCRSLFKFLSNCNRKVVIEWRSKVARNESQSAIKIDDKGKMRLLQLFSLLGQWSSWLTSYAWQLPFARDTSWRITKCNYQYWVKDSLWTNSNKTGSGNTIDRT